MKNILSIILTLFSITSSFAQSPKPQTKDTILVLSTWHIQQIAAFDTEIKRLQATTIEAEVQRINVQRQLLINSFITAKITDPSIIETIAYPSPEKITLTIKKKK